MERNPKECGSSACVGGVYFCRIACIPCVRCKKCAQETIKDMARAMNEIMNGHREGGERTENHESDD